MSRAKDEELTKEIAELKAQTAAMLEKAAAIDQEDADVLKRNGFDSEAAHFEQNAYEIRALIPTDHAAALSEHDAQERLATLHGLSVVLGMKADNLEKWDTWEKFVTERVREAVREEAEWWKVRTRPITYDRRYKDDPIMTNENELNERLAAHRAAAGAQDRPNET